MFEPPDLSTKSLVQDLLLPAMGHPFKPVDTVPFNSTPDELLHQIQDHQRKGLPLVITGLNADPGWPHKYLSGEDFDGEKDQLEGGEGISGHDFCGTLIAHNISSSTGLSNHLC